MFRLTLFAIAVLTSFMPLQKATAQQTAKTAVHAAASNKLSEDEKIDMLLQYLRSMKGASCIRNGSQHTPTEAADHLQKKREKHASEINTAEEFVQYLATKSSATGEYYTVKLPDGHVVKLGDMLMQKLKKIEEQ